MYNLDLVDAAFKDAFPARTDALTVDYVNVASRGDGTLVVTARIIRWDTSEAAPSIRDVIEQELPFTMLRFDLAGITRLRTYLAALVKVIERALLHPAADTMMPGDVLDFSALKLVKANTETEFITALSMPSRLGRYLDAAAR